jgi:RNA polymerase sigma factor (sigma-70 family)
MKSDGQLLAEFVATGAESPFEEILRRHGGLVINTCRRALGSGGDAEDAAQACFLILANKARALQGRASLAGWLHRVAWNVAGSARRAEAGRKSREREAGRMQAQETDAGARLEGLRGVLDEALDSLPEKLRLPLVLHHLEGHSEAGGAELLGLKLGTFSARLARGREMLKDRLARRGTVLSVGLLATMLAQCAGSTGMTPELMASTVKAAALIAGGKVAAATMVSAQALALTKGAIHAMFMAKLKVICAASAAATLLAVGTPLAISGMGVEAGSKKKTDPAAAAATPATSSTKYSFMSEEQWLGKQVVRLAAFTDSPVWSPDGRKVAWLWHKLSKARPRRGAAAPRLKRSMAALNDNGVMVLDLASGKTRSVTINTGTTRWVTFLAWSTDGKSLVAADQGRIWTLSLVARAIVARVLVESFADGKLKSLDFSPQGKHLLCRFEPRRRVPDDVEPRSVVFDLVGKEVGRLRAAAVAWSPDGKRLIYAPGSAVMSLPLSAAKPSIFFDSRNYFAATGRPGHKSRKGYFWGVRPLAWTKQGFLAEIYETPAHAMVMARPPVGLKLKRELALRTGIGAFRKLDAAANDFNKDVRVEYRPLGASAKVLRFRSLGLRRAAGRPCGFVSVIDITTGKRGAELELPAMKLATSRAALPVARLMGVSADGKRIAFSVQARGTGPAGLLIFNVAARNFAKVKLPATTFPIRNISFQPGGKRLVLTLDQILQPKGGYKQTIRYTWLCNPAGKGVMNVQ